MIVFSDLDRSIIYSNKFLDTDTEYKNIEVYNGKQISYISLKSIELVKKIQEKGLFIPTTTRTKEQFERINFKENNINFPWAITSNGAVILKDDKILDCWNEEIKHIKEESEDIYAMVDYFKEFTRMPGVTNFKIAEGTFFYLVVDLKKFNISCLDPFVRNLEKYKWRIHISGRKIYFIPKYITKENAIKYLVEKLGIDEFVAIGDSNMDYGMLREANTSYLLKHGDLVNLKKPDEFIVSEKLGMEGTEEILANILEQKLVHV